jgi:AraC family transcriptional regulator of adaptative response / DNA-3-methyladenine glycosylase II
MRSAPGLRVPGCWDGFELAVRTILGQQITVQGATTLAGRIARTLGQPFATGGTITHIFPTPEVLSKADFTKIGLTRSRAETIRSLARAVSQGEIRFERITDSNAFLNQLLKISGIGEWTAQYVAMRALGEPDALPTGDLGLLRTLGLKNLREMEKRSEGWRPWRAYATMYLWNGDAETTPGVSKSAH